MRAGRPWRTRRRVCGFPLLFPLPAQPGCVTRLNGDEHPGGPSRRDHRALTRAWGYAAAEMEFRILGPLEVLDDSGVPVILRSSRERAVLALLLLSPNRVVSSERLADDLWGDRPPEGAVHALQVNISRLRKVLRDTGAEDVLVTRSPGYLVEVDPDA